MNQYTFRLASNHYKAFPPTHPSLCPTPVSPLSSSLIQNQVDMHENLAPGNYAYSDLHGEFPTHADVQRHLDKLGCL